LLSVVLVVRRIGQAVESSPLLALLLFGLDSVLDVAGLIFDEVGRLL
jgi:hypothetical protein